MRRWWPLLTIVGFGAAVISGLAAPATAAGYFHGHCKDAAHLNVTHPPANATLIGALDVSVAQNQATDAMRCINQPSYRGPIDTLVVTGRADLNLLPTGATYVKDHFAYYTTYQQNAELQHTDAGRFVIYSDFTYQAAGKIAYELGGFGA